MYIWSLFTNPALLEPAQFIVFTILTLIHMALHWSLLVIGEDEKWFWPYVIVQGILAFAIVHLSQNLGMIFALYMALIGEIVGSGRRRKWIILATVYFISLSLISYILLNGMEQSGWWLIGTLPMIIFVVMYVSLYTRASDDRDQARKLLDELEIANRQLAEYTNQVEELTLTTERQRMARELHDTLAQGFGWPDFATRSRRCAYQQPKSPKGPNHHPAGDEPRTHHPGRCPARHRRPTRNPTHSHRSQ